MDFDVWFGSKLDERGRGSAAELARALDLTEDKISRMRKGDRQPKNPNELFRIEKFFGERFPGGVARLVEDSSPDDEAGMSPLTGFVDVDGKARVPPGEIAHIKAQMGLGAAYDAPTIQVTVGSETYAGAEVLETWRLPSSVVGRYFRGNLGRLHIVECEGDSMEPRIYGGDFVALDTTKTVPSPDGLFGIFDGYSIVLKRLELVPNSDPPTVKIISDNPRHGTYERMVDEVKIIGRFAFRLTDN